MPSLSNAVSECHNHILFPQIFLYTANIQAYDLRAGAAMLIAALAADGVSEITNVQYIERGYEDIIGKLRALGAKIDCVEENDEPPIRQIG